MALGHLHVKVRVHSRQANQAPAGVTASNALKHGIRMAAGLQMPQAKSRRRLPSRLPRPVAWEVTTPWPKRSCGRQQQGEWAEARLA